MPIRLPAPTHVARPAPAPPGWSRVHDVVGPLADTHDVDALYVRGARTGAVLATPTGRRRRIEVPALATADLGTYFNAFPAAYWRHGAGSAFVRLEVEVDASALLAVHRSDVDGEAALVDKRALRAGARTAVDVRIDDSTRAGLVWFTLTAADTSVGLVAASWSVAEEPLVPGGLVLGMPTLGLAGPVVHNLRRIDQADALLDVLERFVLVDHGEPDLGEVPELAAALSGLRGRGRLVRQQNLGGSGGFSRVLHEAASVAGAAFVTLMDDDIAVEPAALLRAYEFARRAATPTIVGAQMLDSAAPTVLDAAAETVDLDRFWWHGVEPRLERLDLAAAPLTEVPALHTRHEAGYAGWWTCQIPLSVVARTGYALPLFLKWDDAEFGLRARAAGAEVVSLPGVAVWHDSWRGKDDARGWTARLHARNRFTAALLHGRGPARLLCSSVAHEVKQLLALQYFAVERRHEGLRDLLAGPAGLTDAPAPMVERMRALAGQAPDQRRRPIADLPPVPEVPVSPSAPESAPTGAGLAVWTVRSLLRHAVAPAPRGAAPSVRLRGDSRGWWTTAACDVVAVPTADGAAWYLDRRDPARFRRLLVASVVLHLRIRRAWPALRAAHRDAAPALAAPAAWAARFARAAR